MPDDVRPDRRVVACNFKRSKSAIAKGALAYVYMPNPGGGHDRLWLLARSRGGRWIEQWEATKNLTNFRAKTIPPGHPLYDDERLWDHGADNLAATLAQLTDEEASEAQRARYVGDGVHTIPVPRGWSPEQAWEAIRRGDLLTDPEPMWANVVIEGGRFVSVLPVERGDG